MRREATVSDAEKIASEVIQEFALGSSWSLPVLHKHLVEALIAAEARGYAAAREQAVRRLNAAAADAVEVQLPHCEVVALTLREAADDILSMRSNT
jgi:hypothetical protein